MHEQYRFYHYPICPFSRKIRFIFADKNIPFVSVIENFWEKREKFCLINKSGEIPFLAVKFSDVDKKNLLIFGQNTVFEYLNTKYGDTSYIFGNIEQQTEIRKMSEWFDQKFYNEVSKYILNERIYYWHKYQRSPDIQLLKMARMNLEQHLLFIGEILSSQDWIAGNTFSLADITCACHLSSLDYLGEIEWQNHKIVKDWYTIIKSKPAFRDLLYDLVPGFKPSAIYRELDF
jgi:glutathione S-transferase